MRKKNNHLDGKSAGTSRHIIDISILVFIYKSLPDTIKVSYAKIRNFSQGQGNQGITCAAYN